MNETPVPSPCVQVCQLDEHDLCRGCLRTLEEVAAWPRLDDARKRAVLARIAIRRAAAAG